MAFTLPTFNLSANLWRIGGSGGAYAAPDLTVACNLSFGRRVEQRRTQQAVLTTNVLSRGLLLPKLTDIRATWNAHAPDLVEVPAGSGRFYGVEDVEDVAKGFTNEYRFACLEYLIVGATIFGMPAPVPLP